MFIGASDSAASDKSPVLRNLLHERFPRNQPLLNHEVRQCVSLREA